MSITAEQIRDCLFYCECFDTSFTTHISIITKFSISTFLYFMHDLGKSKKTLPISDEQD